MPCDPAILLLGIYSEELKAGPQADASTPMFREATRLLRISTSAKRQKQHKCPTPDEWINKLYKHESEHYSALKREKF